MIIERPERWGRLLYDTERHIFSYEESAPRPAGPYADRPVALNVVLTHRCNMGCKHCVAKDFAGECEDDLSVTHALTEAINSSPFMLVVITGGEPLLPTCRSMLGALIEGLPRKGIVVDTNGTIEPDRSLLKLFKRRNVLVRVSLDSMNPADEVYLRHTAKGSRDPESIALYHDKLARLVRFSESGVPTGAQTVIYRRGTAVRSKDPVLQIVGFLRTKGIARWYLQRLIPSYHFRRPPAECSLTLPRYEETVRRLAEAGRTSGIQVFAKRDRRHNSVFLLVGKGILYTQGPAPGEKVRLGAISHSLEHACFQYVSAADHAARYYCDKQD